MRLAASLMLSVTSLSASARASPGLAVRGLALGLDAFEEPTRRLVGRVLVHELALEGPLEDGLAEAGAALPTLDLQRSLVS